MKCKQVLASVLSAAMLLSVGSTLAFAADVTYADKGMTFESTMRLDDDAVSAPNVSYTYTIAGVAAADYTHDETTTCFVDSTALVPTQTTATVDFTTSDYNKADGITKTAKFDFATVTYTEPGVYVYTVEEASNPTAFDGLYNETNTTRYVYVTVKNVAETDGEVAISDIIMTSAAIDAIYTNEAGELVTDSAKSNGYVHSYGIEGEDEDKDGVPDDGESEDFIITTVAKGDMANHHKDFTFTVAAAAGIADGTVLKVTDGTNTAFVIKTADGFFFTNETEIPADDAAFTANTAAPFTFEMASGEMYTILSAAKGMEFDATVSDPANDGYHFYQRENETTAWVDGIDGNDVVDGDPSTVDGINFATVRGADNNDPDDEDIEYDKAFPETGVVLDLLPYVVMVALAGAFITFRFVKSARKDEE